MNLDKLCGLEHFCLEKPLGSPGDELPGWNSGVTSLLKIEFKDGSSQTVQVQPRVDESKTIARVKVLMSPWLLPLGPPD